MNYMNRSLLRMGLLSVVMGLLTVAHAMPGRVKTTIQQDSIIVKKDTIAVVPTVPDSLLRERLAKLQKSIPLNYHKAVQAYVDYFTFRKASTTKTMLETDAAFLSALRAHTGAIWPPRRNQILIYCRVCTKSAGYFPCWRGWTLANYARYRS